MGSKRPPLNEVLSLFESMVATEGVTTAPGATAGNSFVDAGLIGVGANSFFSMLAVLYPGQPRLVDSFDITGFNNVTGEVTLASAYKGVAAAIPAGVPYKIVTFRFVPAEVAAIKAKTDTLPAAPADETTSLAIKDNLLPLVNELSNLWTGPDGYTNPNDVTSDGTFIYVSLSGSNPGKVAKIRITTMRTEAVWTGAAGQNSPNEMCLLNGFLYVPCFVNPGQLVKVDPATMTTVTIFVGAVGQGDFRHVITDGTNLYLTCSTSNPGQVIKLDANLNVLLTWTGVLNTQLNPGRMVYDGTNLYFGAGDATVPTAVVVKVNLATMLTVATYPGIAGATGPGGLSYDGQFLYLAIATANQRVIKIDPATMTFAGEYIPETLSSIRDVAFDGTYLYVSQPLLTNTPFITKLNPKNLQCVGKYMAPLSFTNLAVIRFDGQFFYIGYRTTPAKVQRLSFEDINPSAQADAIPFNTQGLVYYGTVTAVPGANQFTIPALAGMGAGKFMGGGPYYAIVFRDAGGVGAAPQGEYQNITVYDNATGTFTTAAFSAVVAVGDEILISRVFPLISITNTRVASICGPSGILQDQPAVAVNINAIVGAETNVFNLSAADTRYLVRSLRLKSVDPGANTVTVRLYELVNGASTVVGTFDITTVNFATYFSLMDCFGVPHLAGDNLRVTVQASAGGPYAITGELSYAKTNN